MSFMDRAKAAAEQMKAKAQEGVEEVQQKKELAQAYWDLGHKAYELGSAGQISHPELDPLVQHISEIQAPDGGVGGSGPAAAAQPEQTMGTTPPQTPA